MESSSPPPKVILLGPPGVGKTSLLTRLMEDRKPEPYLSSVGLKVEQTTILVDGESVELMLWDLAGVSHPAALLPYFFQGAAAYLYVVDLSQAASYRRVRIPLRQLQRLLPQAQGLLWANKLDCLGPAERTQLTRRIRPLPDAWVSAKSGEGVHQAFTHLARRLKAAGWTSGDLPCGPE